MDKEMVRRIVRDDLEELLTDRIYELYETINKLQKEIDDLKRENAELREILNKYC